MSVSRALGGKPGVSEKLRQKILETAGRLGYRPDPGLIRLSHHLRSRRLAADHTTLCAVTDIPAEREPAYCTRLIHHAKERARALGYAFSLLRINRREVGWTNLSAVLSARGVEGVLLLPMVGMIDLGALDWSRFSVICATSSVSGPRFHRVHPDHSANARLLVERLVSRGLNRIGFIGTHSHAERTLEAYPAALTWHHTRAGLRCTPLLHDGAQTPCAVDWAQREKPEVVVLGRPGDFTRHRAEFAAARLEVKWALAGSMAEAHGADEVLDERHDLIGVAAIDTLAGMVMRSERGVSAPPLTISVPGDWHRR